jgi:hypothetical protein
LNLSSSEEEEEEEKKKERKETHICSDFFTNKESV